MNPGWLTQLLIIEVLVWLLPDFPVIDRLTGKDRWSTEEVYGQMIAGSYLLDQDLWHRGSPCR
jgi:hypothetical protein